MKHFCTTFFSDFDKELELMKNSNLDMIAQTNITINWIESRIKILHKWLKKHKFETTEEEICFFKELKPKIVSNLIYHHTILKLMINEPVSKKLKIKYYEKAFEKIHAFQMNNREFYQYYRSRASYKDVEYFTRNNNKTIVLDDCYLINYDNKLCTSHDYKLANFIANDMLSVYLDNILSLIQNNNVLTPLIQSNIYWTGTKVDMVEFVYAIQNLKCINHGNLETKEVLKVFCGIFNIDISEKNCYRWYQDIKKRKTVRTRFLNSLAESLESKIEKELEKEFEINF